MYTREGKETVVITITPTIATNANRFLELAGASYAPDTVIRNYGVTKYFILKKLQQIYKKDDVIINPVKLPIDNNKELIQTDINDFEVQDYEPMIQEMKNFYEEYCSEYFRRW